MASDQRFHLTINGRGHTVDVAPDTPLLYVLRDTLGMDGTRFGCGLAQCGACTVHVAGKPVRSCSYPVQAVGAKPVTTIEGIAADAHLRKLQEAVVQTQAPQCGYCMSGMVMSAAALVKSKPHASESDVREALDGNLCRCACHLRVIRAVVAFTGQTA